MVPSYLLLWRICINTVIIVQSSNTCTPRYSHYMITCTLVLCINVTIVSCCTKIHYKDPVCHRIYTSTTATICFGLTTTMQMICSDLAHIVRTKMTTFPLVHAFRVMSKTDACLSFCSIGSPCFGGQPWLLAQEVLYT